MEERLDNSYEINENSEVFTPAEAVERFMASEHVGYLMGFLEHKVGVDMGTLDNLLLETCGAEIERVLKNDNEVELLAEAGDLINEFVKTDLSKFVYFGFLDQDRKNPNRGSKAFLIDRIIFSAIYDLYEEEIKKFVSEKGYRREVPIFEANTPRMENVLCELIEGDTELFKKKIEYILLEEEQPSVMAKQDMAMRILFKYQQNTKKRVFAIDTNFGNSGLLN